jgi:hypothetical protein
MGFLKRLFGRKETQAEEVPPELKGAISSEQARRDIQAQGANRTRMEAEVKSDRERRGATDERPGNSA